MRERSMKSRRLLAVILAVMMLMTLNAFSVSAATVDNSSKAGTYTGEARGYKDGLITVTVTLAEQDNAVKITDIKAEGEDQTANYWSSALTILDKIKEKNGTDGVDTVSGATVSSKGILDATDAALAKASGRNIFDGGSGTKADPYVISSADTMQALSESVAAGEAYADKYISLGKDIDLAGIDWTPIGDKDHLFSGIFNGKGHTVSNLTIGSESSPAANAVAGLFGYVTVDSQFHNVRLTGVKIYTNAEAMTYAGSLAAYAKVDTSKQKGTLFQNCHAEGVISVNTGDAGTCMAGGLVGFGNQYMTMANCGADVDVTASTGTKIANAGGLVGYESIRALTVNCYSLGDVKVDSSNKNCNVGGLAGGANGMLYNNYTASEVTAPATATKTGALAGTSAAATILSHCYHDKDRTATAVGDNRGETGTDGTVGKTSAEIASEDFKALLSSNLTESARNAFAQEVAGSTAVKGLDYSARTETFGNSFYDWTLADGKVTHSKELWANSVIDASIFAGGSGTAEDPYTIETEDQLRTFAKSLTSKLDYSGVYIKLTKDIELKGGRWIPIGEGEYAFKGSFDGDGHSITGLTIGSKDAPYEDPAGESAGMYFGLFGVLDTDAEVRDLSIDADINVTSAQTIYVSGVAGYMKEALVDGVTVSGSIKGATTNSKGNIFVGGITGNCLRQKVINTVVTADIRAEAVGGIAEAGGIAGLLNRGLIANSYSTGKISGTADREAEGAPSLGGIAAVHAGTILNCYSLSPVEAECYTGYAGALAGWATGIADTFQSYFCKTTEIVTDSKTDAKTVISPAVAIGWSVGPGVNDEGEPFTGSVSINVKGLDSDTMKSDDFAKQLTDNIGRLNADLAKGGRQDRQWTGSDALSKSLRSWKSDGSKAVLGDTTIQAVYDKDTDGIIESMLPEKAPDYYEGTFYGRYTDEKTNEQTIVKVVINDESRVRDIEVTAGSGDYSDVIAAIIAGKTAVSDLDDGAFKSALRTALDKAAKNDTTTYGRVDGKIFAGGSGTAEDPWIIHTETQLRDFAASVNEDEDYSGRYVRLDRNIRLADQWIPAGGTNPWPFAGTFDGDGYRISGMQIGSQDSPYKGYYAGLFAYVKGGKVKNLTLSGISVNMKNSGGESRIYAGGAAAAVESQRTDGELDNVKVTGTVKVHSNSKAAYAGGIVGQDNGGVITNSFADVKIDAVSDAAWVYAGGIEGIGARNGAINNYARGSVQVKGPVNKTAAGGIAGFQSGAVYNCWADVDVIAVSSTGDIGGLAGRNTGIGMMLNSCYSSDAQQRSGGSAVAEKKAVGTVVKGTSGGYGAAEGLEAVEDIAGSDFADRLNRNISDDEALDRVKTLIKSDGWEAGKADSLKLMSWTTSSKGSVRLATAEESAAASAKIKESAQKIDDQIKAIGTVTMSSAKEIAAARKAYDSASDEVKALVTELKSLEAAEKTLAELQQADRDAVPGRVSGVKASAASYNTAKISWTKDEKAKGYTVYRAESKNGSYTELDTTSKTSMSDSGLKTGKTYYYKVEAYAKHDGRYLTGETSGVVSVKTVLSRPSGVKARAGVKKATVSWKKTAGAAGYKVYRSTKKSSGYKLVKTVKSSRTTSFSNTKLAKKKTYYYKIKAYRTVDGRNVYSSYSSAVKVKTK